MLALMQRNKYDILLFITFLLMVIFIGHYYPVPQSAWDTSYYVERSIDLKPHMRPIGYALFIRLLYIIPNLYFIVLVQYTLYFAAVFAFTQSLKKITGLSNPAACLLNILLLAEPAGLYFSMNILSDILFSCLTLFYLSSLVEYFRTRKSFYLLLHALLLFACLQTRLLALFYPVFSCIALIVVIRRWSVLKYCVLLLAVLLLSNFIDKSRNKSEYGVRVVSPFSGWTAANNAIYAAKIAHPDPALIKDSAVRSVQVAVNAYLDTTHDNVPDASSFYLWEATSPLTYIYHQALPSVNGDYMRAFYAVAPLFQKYGNYIISHYPASYIKGYMGGNMHSMLSPHDGEMMDYYQMSTPSEIMMTRYHVDKDYFYCRYQIYKEHINQWNNLLHKIRLALFAIAILIFGYFLLKKNRSAAIAIGTLILFGVLYFGAMLYSSLFMPRYIIPALQVETAVILLTCFYLFTHRPRTPEENR